MLTIRLMLIIFFISFSGAFADEGFHPKEPVSMKWKFEGLTGTFDRQSIQRGYQVYKEVCAACHSMNRISFRNLKDVGFSEEEVKAIAKSYQVKDGPNDAGEMFERPGILSDYFVNPFPNKEAAAAANNGAIPPDLSLIIKARHNGANYLYSLLTGYEGDKVDENGLHINPYFSTGKLAMAPPLSPGLVQYADQTEPTLQNMSYDVVNFLQWAAEPEMEVRKRMGMKVAGFFILLTAFIIFCNRKLWLCLYKNNEKSK